MSSVSQNPYDTWTMTAIGGAVWGLALASKQAIGYPFADWFWLMPSWVKEISKLPTPGKQCFEVVSHIRHNPLNVLTVDTHLYKRGDYKPGDIRPEILVLSSTGKYNGAQIFQYELKQDGNVVGKCNSQVILAMFNIGID